VNDSGSGVPARMSFNENPYPPPLRVQKAIAAAAAEGNRRPDQMCSELSAAIARKLSVPVEHVLVCPGSAALLNVLVTTRCAGHGEVLHAWPTFELYPFLAQTAGINAVAVPLSDHHQDVDGMVDAATADTRVAVLCNPNNPTGTTVSAGGIQRFLDGMPDDTTVVIDEAYREFADPDIPDGIDFYRADERVCVVRTFSKAYGLFGLRVGYAVAHEPLRSSLAIALMSFMVNGVGQAAALEALEAEEEMRQRCADIVEERDRMYSALLEQGWQVPRSEVISVVLGRVLARGSGSGWQRGGSG
jgi:histidinol-phosphate aminotransferase